MIKLDLNDLNVSTFAADPGSGGGELGDTTTGQTDLQDTDPRACPWTQGWDCPTMKAGCETSPGYHC